MPVGSSILLEDVRSLTNFLQVDSATPTNLNQLRWELRSPRDQQVEP